MKRYRAHPAFGLREMRSSDWTSFTPTHEFGFHWLRRSRDARRRGEERFFSALLRQVAQTTPTRYAAVFDELDDAESFAAHWSASRDGCAVTGECTGNVGEALAKASLVEARIEQHDGSDIVIVKSPWNSVEVRLPADRVRELRSQLEGERDGHASAFQADSDHPVRAALYIAVANAWIIAALVALATMILLDTVVARPITFAIGCCVLVVLVFAIGPLQDFILKRLI
jgi:hypothetical protein